MKEKKVYMQVQCDESTRDKGHKVAQYDRVSLSDVLRLHVEARYSKLPKEAK
jgi:hypothetical protein